jgi:hypothetical protein
VLGSALWACAPDAPPAATAPPGATTQAAAQLDEVQYWRALTQPLNGEQVPGDGSFAVIVPRRDIDLESEMGQVPTSAGIASRFYFFRCTCGKVKIVGDFLACDFETDDVLDALRGGKFTIDSMGPILQNTRPIVYSIRFQGEGDGPELIKALRNALDETGRRAPPHSMN